MTHHDFDYYSKRAQQEREHAERCLDHSARHVHLELAERYAAMVRDLQLNVVSAQR